MVARWRKQARAAPGASRRRDEAKCLAPLAELSRQMIVSRPTADYRGATFIDTIFTTAVL
jgi:hypothetical protein